MISDDLLLALKPVKHCGDYGILWVNEPQRRIHLTMGDADGSPEDGFTSFEEIAARVEAAAWKYWPEFVAEERWFEQDAPLVIADEWDPAEGERHEGGWVEVGFFGVAHWE